MKPRKLSYTQLVVLCIIFAVSVGFLRYRLSILLLDASRKGDSNTAVWLIRLGANPNYVRYLGGTCSEAPLSVSLQHIDTLKALIDNGADVNLPIEEGHPALLLAAQSGYNDAITLLLEHGASFSDSWGDTALIMAASSRRTDTMRLLIDKGDDVNASSKSGQTALAYCAIYGNIDGIRLLIDNGADVNKADNTGVTALMSAASNGEIDAVKFVLDNGANINMKQNGGYTAADLARKSGHDEVVRLLVKAGVLLDPKLQLNEELVKAVDDCDIERAKSLLDDGADVNARGEGGRTVLMLASWHGDYRTVKELLRRGADVKATVRDDKTTALQFAQTYPDEKHYQKVVKLLNAAGLKN